MFDKVIKSSLCLLVFLLPIFWLPFSFEIFEFNKQYLLFFLSSLAFLAWIGKMVLADKEIRIKKTPLNIPVLVFLFIAVLSAVFSADKTSSLLGFYGRFSDGLIGLLSFGMLFFTIINNTGLKIKAKNEKKKITTQSEKLEKKEEDNKEETASVEKEEPKKAAISSESLLASFIFSTFFVILLSYLSVFGVLAKLSGSISNYLPSLVFQKTFNPAAGSLEGLSIFLSIIVVLLTGLILFQSLKSKFKTIICILILFASLPLLVIIDFTSAWLVLLITLLLFVGFAISKRIFKKNVNRLLLPIFLVIIAAVFAIIPQRVINLDLPQEQVLSQGESSHIAWGAATDSIKTGFLGSGIGTFSYDFSKYRSQEFNQNQLWQIRFDRPASHILEILATTGFLGLLSYLILIVSFVAVSLRFLQLKNAGQAPLFLAFLALLISHLVYYQNTALALAFWLILALAVAGWTDKNSEKRFSFADFPELSLVLSTLLIIISLVFGALYFFAGKFYIADKMYIKNVQAESRAAQIDKLEEIVNLNPYRIQYRVVLARLYLSEVKEAEGISTSEEGLALIQTNVGKAIEQAKTASEISPNRVIVWETLGMLYRDIQSIAPNALEWSLKSFEKAIELEPNNPVLYTELGKLMESEEARAKFAKALELKPDYVDALMQAAFSYEKEGDIEAAIKEMEKITAVDVEILFHLGRMYFNNQQIDEAINRFLAVATVQPNHSNALYSLGVAYSAKGEKDLAIQAFEIVLELNPGNTDVVQKIEELKK
ncbi:tetratricopeptide repeat protein [Candidatus Parcubacteria bacterium]|nr:tetratricopeptide repeat protein [Candidatus Parcubacteria bacterium]